MFPLSRGHSTTPSLKACHLADERTSFEIGEAKSWAVAQWRRSNVPVLKVRDSLLIDLRRWAGNISPGCSNGNDDEVLKTAKVKVPEKWYRAEDQKTPVRFSLFRKVCISTSIVLMTCMSLLAYTTISAISSKIAYEFNTKSNIAPTLFGTIYLLGVGIGSILLAPLSEKYGRLPVYHANSIVFIMSLIGCSRANSSTTLLIFRMISGMAGSASLVLGGPTIRDIVYAEERSNVKMLWSLCRLSPLFGYIAAQYGTVLGRELVELMDWRNIFRALAACAMVVFLMSAVLLKETYAPKLQSTQQNVVLCSGAHQHRPSFLPFTLSSTSALPSLVLPLKLLIGSPAVFLVSAYTLVTNSYLYLLYPTLPSVFADTYNSTRTEIDIAYLGIGTGMTVGLIYLLFVYPQYSLVPQASQRLETLLAMTIPGAILMPISLFVYGWSLHFRLHYAFPMAATAMMGAALLTTFVPIQIYLIDSFTIHAASALVPSILMQNIAGTLLPLAAPHLLGFLGVAWLSSLVGCTALMLFPFPFLFVRYGKCVAYNLK